MFFQLAFEYPELTGVVLYVICWCANSSVSFLIHIYLFFMFLGKLCMQDIPSVIPDVLKILYVLYYSEYSIIFL